MNPRIPALALLGLGLSPAAFAESSTCISDQLHQTVPIDQPRPPPAESLEPFLVNVVVLTMNADAPTASSLHADPDNPDVVWTGAEVLAREVETHLVENFHNAAGDSVCGTQGCIEFELLGVAFRRDIEDTDCTELLDLADPASSGAFDPEGEDSLGDVLIRAAARCDDPRVRAQGAINLYVYDHCSWSDGEADCSTKTSFGGEKRVGTCYSPAVFLDVARLQHQKQAPEEHEMGHALGLQHNCDPGITSVGDSSNIMQSSCGSSSISGGKRDLGFGEVFHEQDAMGEAYDQQAALLSMAAEIQGNWCGDYGESLGDVEDTSSPADDEYDKGCATVAPRGFSPWPWLVLGGLVLQRRRRAPRDRSAM